MLGLGKLHIPLERQGAMVVPSTISLLCSCRLCCQPLASFFPFLCHPQPVPSQSAGTFTGCDTR